MKENIKEKVTTKFLKTALNTMNDDQLKSFEYDINCRMEYLKDKLMNTQCDVTAFEIREEHAVLKQIRSMFIVDLTIAKF